MTTSKAQELSPSARSYTNRAELTIQLAALQAAIKVTGTKVSRIRLTKMISLTI
jgi:hypothetical protein